MVKRIVRILICLLLFVLLFSQFALAENYSKYIIDDAKVLDSESIEALESKIEELHKKHNIAVVLTTSNVVPYGKTVEFTDDLYENGGYGFDGAKSGIAYLIDFNNREIHISTAGRMIGILNDARIDKLLYAGDSYLSDKQYGKTMLSMLDMLDDFVKKGVVEGGYIYDEQTGEIIGGPHKVLGGNEIIIALVAAIFVFVVLVFFVNRSYNLKYNTYNYNIENNVSVEMIDTQDVFLREEVTRTRRPKNTSGGSGGGSRSSGSGSRSHTSSGGTSFGGGSRKF
ncbi:MAG: TPM domain-containing protein [Christensenellaceae bacterium]|nr:TPM domain-containing protein [Christensenellaceae bacterium]